MQFYSAEYINTHGINGDEELELEVEMLLELGSVRNTNSDAIYSNVPMCKCGEFVARQGMQCADCMPVSAGRRFMQYAE